MLIIRLRKNHHRMFASDLVHTIIETCFTQNNQRGTTHEQINN